MSLEALLMGMAFVAIAIIVYYFRKDYDVISHWFGFFGFLMLLIGIGAT
jgi:hypothetical protein